MAAPYAKELGKVYLVGAGPGDPGLITLRAVEVLGRADVVLYDGLANPRLLQHAPAGAQCTCVGKHGQTRIWSQEEINQQMVDAARQGLAVVRLKGGDPAIFAREADELAALVEHGIPYEIVPGVTAALAASSYCGIPVTHRDYASAVALVTGQEQGDKEAPSLDYEALARFPGTLVFYMGVTTVDRWTGGLLEAGKPGDTPAAIIRRCSLPDQRVIYCRLDEVARQLAPERRIRPPVIVIVGQVAALGATYSWFDKRPLFGHCVLVTRPAGQSRGLANPLQELGAEVLYQPAITIGDPADWQAVDEALKRLDQFDWLVFSSANGVRYFFDRLISQGRDVRALGGSRIAAIGPATDRALARYYLRADLIPDEYRAEALAEALKQQAAGSRFLLVRASRGREVLAEQLSGAGAAVEQIVVYSSLDVQSPDPQIEQRMQSGQIHWTTVTSSAIARSLVTLFGDSLRHTQLVSISPVTSETLRQLGFAPAAEAMRYTMDGVVEALVRVASGE